MKNKTIVYITVFIFLFLSACADEKSTKTSNENNTDSSNQDEKIIIGYVNWAEGVAMTHLFKNIIINETDYSVELKEQTADEIYSSLAKGEIDFFMDAWLPLTHKGYIDKYGDNLEKLGVNYKDCRLGLVVPQYVNIESIKDLNQSPDKFKKRIVGIGISSGIMRQTNVAVDQYKLNLRVFPSSGPVMAKRLGIAYKNKEPIVVTGWKPHWKFAEYDLKLLDDPQKVYGEAENIYTVARKFFKKEYPELVERLNSFRLSDEQINGLMKAIRDAENATKGAEKWYKANKTDL